MLAFCGLLRFHTNFRSFKNSSVKNIIGILMEVEFNVYTAFGSIATLILILPVQEHGKSFHHIVSSMVSFYWCLNVLNCCEWEIFLISFLESLLSVSIKALTLHVGFVSCRFPEGVYQIRKFSSGACRVL